MRYTILILSLFTALFAREITQANWYHHSNIEAIRAEYSTIERQIKNHHYYERKRTVEDEDIGIGGETYIFADSAGHVRKLTIFEGDSDSAARYEYSYRIDGSLLSIWYEYNHYSSMHLSVRSYFAPDGTLLFRKVDDQGGVKPVRSLDIRDPRKVFRTYTIKLNITSGRGVEIGNMIFPVSHNRTDR
jgi:hypothetical protein